MFFVVKLDKTILLEPRFFGPDLEKVLVTKVTQDVEGTCSASYGFVICVTNVRRVGLGVILPQQGSAKFRMKFEAVVFRPFKGEVFDTTVTFVNHMGFDASVGPLTVFVAKKNIPDDMKFHDPGKFMSEDENGAKPIEKGSVVRMKVIGVSLKGSQISCVGTINEDFLGPLE
eukprot:c4332_g1_i1.p1 GENE.c4332_g1_i1~~c4332_g1_i1.p1  ORF type:complete len:172 (+),score=44.45 c4332_g1_i1:41-556(+)